MKLNNFNKGLKVPLMYLKKKRFKGENKQWMGVV